MKIIEANWTFSCFPSFVARPTTHWFVWNGGKLIPDYTVSHSVKQKFQVHCNKDVHWQFLRFYSQFITDIIHSTLHKLRTSERVVNYGVKISLQYKCLRGGVSPPFSLPLLSPYPYRRLFSALVQREYLKRCVLHSLVLMGGIGLWKWVSYQAVACDWQIRIEWLLQCSDCHNRMDVQGRYGNVTHKTAP